MCCKISFNKILVFSIALMIGIWSAICFHVYINSAVKTPLNSQVKEKKSDKKVIVQNKAKVVKEETGNGSSYCNGYGSLSHNSGRDYKSEKTDKELGNQNSKGLQILSQPRPEYTKEARKNNIQGMAMLTVTFKSNCKIGKVSAVKELPDGLTERAIQAAKKIKFIPAKLNGKSQTVTKRIQYNFTIY